MPSNQQDSRPSGVEPSTPSFNSRLEAQWDSICENLEKSPSPTVQWITKSFLRRLSVEGPVLVGYVTACILLHLLNVTILPGVSRWLGVRQRPDWFNPLHYLFMVTHIFGHENLHHLRSNIANLLLVGPSTEHVFGSHNLLFIMFVVAICSGLTHMILGPPHTTQIGASGVVFALILLNSLVSVQRGKIPISFVLTAVLFLGDELWQSLFARDTIAHSAHLVGAFVGTVAGYMIHDHNDSKLSQEKANKKGGPKFWKRLSKRSKKD